MNVDSYRAGSENEAQDDACSICTFCNIQSDICSASCPSSERTRNVVTQKMDQWSLVL